MIKKPKSSTGQNKPTYQYANFISGAFGIVLSYSFLSRAFSSGSYWQYLGSVVFLVLGIKLIARSLKIYRRK